MPSLPTSDADLFSDATLRDPWALYDALRAAGPAVWMTHGAFVAVAGYAEVRHCLEQPEVFISGAGVALNEVANASMVGTVLGSDGAEHAMLRAVLAEQLSMRGLRRIGADVQRIADGLVAGLLGGRTFDVVGELAERLPSTVVLDLIGLPEDRRARIIAWAKNSFDLFGPMTSARTLLALQSIGEVFAFCDSVTQPGVLRPGSLGEAVVAAVAAGRLPADKASGLMLAYLTGGLDTTIASIEQAMRLFAAHPEQWDLVRQDPRRIPGAYNEILRHSAPLHVMSRKVARDTEIGGAAVAAGTRVALLFAAANRDGRKYEAPERFEVLRAPVDHLTFGFGTHVCAGQNLARIEVHALLTALAREVTRIEVGACEVGVNNLIHGYARMEARLH
jgi:cytochrome P450